MSPDSPPRLEVVRASLEDRGRLSALFELYAYDFSEILPIDVGADGRFAVPVSLGDHWTDPHRHPFLFRMGDRLAGFALVHRGSRLSGDPEVWDMAEFFVPRRYRRRGLGEQAARWLFSHFAGRWEVREKLENVAATAFWRRVIGAHTSGQFEQRMWNDERWRGPVQSFG